MSPKVSLSFVAFLLSGFYLSPSLPAQSSEALRREKIALDKEDKDLERTRIDLELRKEALKQRRANYDRKMAEVLKMPMNFARAAALEALKRDQADMDKTEEILGQDRERHRAKKESFDKRLEDWKRRDKADRESNQFRVDERVLVEWKGEWWAARIVRVENGRYYITYDNYGSEWDEWVTPSRIKKLRPRAMT